MGFVTRGVIHAIFATEQKTERFRVREFVVELGGASKYPQFCKFQLTGDRCEMIDGMNQGDEVNVDFQLQGREWQSPQGDTRYFNSLNVWEVERLKAAAPPPGPASEAADIPF